MFSKTIFKQTLKSNYKLWLLFTVIMCTLSGMIMAVYDPQTISSLMGSLEGTALGEMAGGIVGNMTTLLGMLGNSFYSMIGVMLSIVYIIITANSLVASQVDRGSMAYTLSTPIKRIKVVATQAIYLITALVAMLLAVMGVGIIMVQAFHGGIFTTAYTEDVIAVAKSIDVDRQTIEDDLNLILTDDSALKLGAEKRGIDEDIYRIYLNLRITQKSYEAAANVLGIEVEDVSADLSLIIGNEDALSAAATLMGISDQEYRTALEMTIATQQASAEQMEAMQEKLITGMAAAADVLDMELSDIANDLSILKSNTAAMDAAVEASAIPEATFITLINQQMANQEIILDEGLDFNIKDYLILNLGMLLLLFATSGISFASSCIFNLSSYSFAVGGGLPFVFFIFKIMEQTGDSLKFFRYFSINTLFDASAVTSGGDYILGFVALGIIGIALYTLGIVWFQKKDLPL